MGLSGAGRERTVRMKLAFTTSMNSREREAEHPTAFEGRADSERPTPEPATKPTRDALRSVGVLQPACGVHRAPRTTSDDPLREFLIPEVAERK